MKILIILLIIIISVHYYDSFYINKYHKIYRLYNVIDQKVNNNEINNELKYKQNIQSFYKSNSTKKIINYNKELLTNNELTQSLLYYTYKILQRMNRNELAMNLINDYIVILTNISNNQYYQSIDMNITSLLVKDCCRYNNIKSINEIFNIIDRLDDNSIDIPIIPSIALPIHLQSTTNSSIKLINYSNVTLSMLLYPEYLITLLKMNLFDEAIRLLDILVDKQLYIHTNICKTIVKMIIKDITNYQYTIIILNRLLTINGLHDYEFSQLLANNYLKTLDFVKGIVDVSTIPTTNLPEVAFIGRSNVGKSSLINFVCNRKNLAFISKKPGKTSEINYFYGSTNYQNNISNQSIDFYLVDLPGVGYAEVSKEKRQLFNRLLIDYVKDNKNLVVLYHLIDSRHGLLESDKECLDLISQLSINTQYTIILTKVDKLMNQQLMNNDDHYILRNIDNEIKLRTNQTIPILFTSSESKIGGANVWINMLNAIKPIR